MLRIFKFNNEDVEKNIKEFKEANKVTLPQQYEEFLKKYNGGNTPKTNFKINGVSSDIRAFFGFGNASKDYNFLFLKENDFLKNHLDKQFLPIATDSFGNIIVIGIGKENNGEIHFFDCEKSLYKHLRDNFEEFIQKVKSKKFVVRSIEERIHDMKESGSNIEIDEDLINLWQSEIDKYSGSKQEKVII
ncbi:SMI1/KNR4 family protein [Oceanobacillus sp. J11TS1]|uniref:SMI1/KNR4 family protein n=1 Tax=Oceanobacillus sp. J11TS1 TaxID=2807191 RepID=UPI001B0F854C|nr:SMI1/KNR4 family protein [Oceanobacillus sp. J11TS1]GIO24385.1 hypothetical protein J11TS1_29660 [Oceanobacillus sp. J11TS1]